MRVLSGNCWGYSHATEPQRGPYPHCRSVCTDVARWAPLISWTGCCCSLDPIQNSFQSGTQKRLLLLLLAFGIWVLEGVDWSERLLFAPFPFFLPCPNHKCQTFLFGAILLIHVGPILPLILAVYLMAPPSSECPRIILMDFDVESITRSLTTIGRRHMIFHSFNLCSVGVLYLTCPL